jgi:hypothetical protein
MLLSLAVVCGLAACDDAPVPPKNLPVADEKPATAPAPTRPTTQDLITGPRKKLSLNVIPFNITVPESWEVKTSGELVFLQGPAPAGDVQIQLAKRPQLSKDEVESLLRAAKKDADAHPEAKKLVELRTMPTFRILDRQSVSNPIAVPMNGPDGKPTIVQTTPYQWTLMLILPRGSSFDAYELNFYDLTLEQFKADKDFLRMILDSLSDEVAPSA